VPICTYHLLGRSVALEVSRRAFTAESRIQIQPSPFGACGEQRGTGKLFEDFGFPLVRIISRMPHTHWSTHYRHFVTSATESFNNTRKNYVLEQCFSTAGPRPGIGPRHQLYRSARGSPGICHFRFLSIFHE